MMDARWKNGQKTAYRLIKEFIILNKFTTREQIIFVCNTLLPLFKTLYLDNEQLRVVFEALCAVYVVDTTVDSFKNSNMFF